MLLRAKALFRPALATLLLLMIPAAAMQFGSEVAWSLSDFVIMGTLIFCAGLAFEVVTSRRGSVAYRIAFGIAIVLTLLLVWANLAVGFVGSGPNLPNILLGLAPLVVLIGAILSRLRPHGMARTMYAMAVAVAAAPLIGLVVNRPRFSEGVAMTLGIAAFFSLLYVVSGVLFRNSAAGSSAGTSGLAGEADGRGSGLPASDA